MDNKLSVESESIDTFNYWIMKSSIKEAICIQLNYKLVIDLFVWLESNIIIIPCIITIIFYKIQWVTFCIEQNKCCIQNK